MSSGKAAWTNGCRPQDYAPLICGPAKANRREAHNIQTGVDMLRWNSLLVIASFFVLAPLSSPTRQAVIDQDIWVPAPPLGHCVVPELAGTVFKATFTPGGDEYLPGRCG